MAAPTFLCVGMPKCGTSTLHDFLARQRGFFVPPVKEINFFAYDLLDYNGGLLDLFFSRNWAARQDRLALLRNAKRVILTNSPPRHVLWALKYALGPRHLDWYFSLFPEDCISGEISPAYCMLSANDVHRIAKEMPNIKIIIMFRSPLQQIWSHCRMAVVRNRPQPSAQAFKEHIERLTEMRRSYRGLVEDWSSKFGERLFVGYLEEMAANPNRFFATLTSFLGADTGEGSFVRDTSMLRRSHVGVPFDVPKDIRSTLADHAAIRLQGFEAISPCWAAEWSAELDDFRHRRTPI